MNDLQVPPGVFVHGYVAEADHLLHLGCEIGRQDAGGLQERKCVAAILWDAKLTLADEIHGQVDCRFTGLLKIEHDGILLGLIRFEIAPVSREFSLNALKTSFDAGGFVEDHVVSHTPVPVW